MNAREIIEKVQSSRAFRALTEEKTTGLLRTVGLAADEDADMNPKNIQKQRAIVEEAAKNYADPKAVMSAYRDGQDAERFLRNYDIAYRNGQTGMIGRYSTKSREITRDMTENQILKAHEAGRKAAGYEGEAAEGSVRTGEKWNDLQNPGRKVASVAEGTAAGEAGQEAGKGAGSFAAGQKVSAEMLGITGGTDEKNLTYRAPEQWNADERAAAAIAKEHGLNITIVQGGSIKTGETADGVKKLVKSRALVEGDTMIVRSDDPTMSAEQLARHEATHKRIETGEVQLGSTVRQLLKKYSPAQIREIIHLYAEAYGNVNMNAAQVLEEIVCDAMAEMNAFATEQMESVAGEVGRFLRDVQKAAQGTALEGGQKKNAREGVKYSIQNITGESGQDYGVGVYLDSQLLSGLTDSERITMVKEFVKELGGQSFTAYEPDGSETAIKIAEPNQRFKNKSGKSVPVIGDLTTKYNKNITKQEAIVLIDELVATSQYQRSEPAKHTHGWLDNNGKNSWELWTTYIQDRDNVIWKASLNVATATDGKRYLYDIPKIKKVEQPGERRAHLPPTATVAQQGQNVNQKHSRELETIEELKQQNELLKKQVDYWHSQTAVTVGERGADKEEVKKLARQLRRDYGSQTEVSDYLPELQWLADNRQNKKARFADMMQTAENVARQVLDGCRVNVNEEQMETMKELKKFLRGRYINVDDSLKEDIGDFKDFKKLNRALHFREDGSGTGVDSLWLELQDQFGKGLFPENVQNPADQIRHIADTVGTMEAQWVNPYDADMELTVQQMTNDVMAKTLNLNRMEGTRADKAAEQAAKELTYLLEKGRKRELRRIEGAQQTAQRQSIRGMAEKFKRMALKPGKGDTQHAPQQLIGAVTEFCEIFNDSEIRRAERQRATLEERTKAFDEAVKSEGGGSAEEYRVILTTRQRIDKMEAALSRLKGIYAEMKDNQYDTVYEDSVAEMLGQLSGTLRGKDIYNLSGADLGKVKNTMAALMYSVTNANKAFSLGKDKLVSRTAQDWAAGMRQVDHKAAGWRTLARRYEMWQMTPDTWFNYSCGYAKGNVGQEIQKAFVRGEERMMEVQREYYQMYREFTESKEYAKELRSLLNEQKKKRVFWGLHDEAGSEVKTSRGIMLQAYMLLCQKDSFESLQLGGFSLPDQDVYYSGNIKGAFGDMDEGTMFSESGGASYRDLQHDQDVLLDKLTELGKQMQTTPEGKKAALLQEVKEAETQVKDIQREMKGIADRAGKKLLGLKDNIEGQLTPLERQLVERAHDWYSHTGSLMADVFEQMYGYRPMLIDGYTPIHRDADTIKTDIRDMAGAAKAFNLENSSFTIDRVKNAQPILLTDFFWELNSQKEKMSRYVGFAQVQKDFGRIWKTRVSSNGMTINKLVAAKFGTGDTGFGVSGTKYVENYIMDIAGGRKSEDVLGDLYGHYAAATLRLNPRVAVSQAASIPTAASVVGWKSMAAGFAKGLPKAGSTRFRNDLAARNVWFWQRYRGEGGSTELSDIRMKGGVIEKIANSSVGKKLFNWCQEVDVFSTGSIMWYAAEDYVKTTRGLTAGMDGFESAVNEVYTDIIRKSQPNYTTTERADLLRDGRAHMKLLTMFKTQSSQNLNLLLEANGEFIRMKQDLKNGRNNVTAADLKAAGTKLANASTGVFLGGTAAFVALRTIVNFMMGMVNPYRDKDTDEVTLEGTIKGMGKEMLSSLAGTVAMGGQVYDLVMSVISGDSYYGLSDSAISSISGLLENTQKVIANALDEDKEITGDQLWKMANSWCQVLGIPSGNAKKIYDMLEMYVTGVRDGTLGQYPSDKTSSNQYRERVVQAVLGGETERANDALAILFAKSGGDTDEEIKKDIASGMRTYLKRQYEKGEVSDTEAEKIMAYTGTDDPKGTRERWDFLLEHPEMEASRVSDNLVAAYNQRGDINEDVFLAAWEFAKNAKGDKDSKGKTVSGSKKKKVVAYVQKLSLTRAQKKRLYELLDVGSTKDTPW